MKLYRSNRADVLAPELGHVLRTVVGDPRGSRSISRSSVACRSVTSISG
jgi:hypothetical protein